MTNGSSVVREGKHKQRHVPSARVRCGRCGCVQLQSTVDIDGLSSDELRPRTAKEGDKFRNVLQTGRSKQSGKQGTPNQRVVVLHASGWPNRPSEVRDLTLSFSASLMPA
jgi:hypothetical protein